VWPSPSPVQKPTCAPTPAYQCKPSAPLIGLSYCQSAPTEAQLLLNAACNCNAWGPFKAVLYWIATLAPSLPSNTTPNADLKGACALASDAPNVKAATAINGRNNFFIYY